jgi:hypothetical protein
VQSRGPPFVCPRTFLLDLKASTPFLVFDACLKRTNSSSTLFRNLSGRFNPSRKIIFGRRDRWHSLALYPDRNLPWNSKNINSILKFLVGRSVLLDLFKISVLKVAWKQYGPGGQH